MKNGRDGCEKTRGAVSELASAETETETGTESKNEHKEERERERALENGQQLQRQHLSVDGKSRFIGLSISSLAFGYFSISLLFFKTILSSHSQLLFISRSSPTD